MPSTTQPEYDIIGCDSIRCDSIRYDAMREVYFIALYCILLHCIALYCIVFVLFCFVLSCISAISATVGDYQCQVLIQLKLNDTIQHVKIGFDV